MQHSRSNSLDRLLDWSLDLLTPDELQVLSRLAVLADGFDLSLAETDRRRIRDKVAKLRFPDPAPCGKTPLMATDLSRSYGSLEIFTAVDLAIDRGSRVVILGFNGAGKTTTMRTISGVRPVAQRARPDRRRWHGARAPGQHQGRWRHGAELKRQNARPRTSFCAPLSACIHKPTKI